MKRPMLIAATTAAIGALAVAAPIAGADPQAPPSAFGPSGNVCLQLAMQGPMAVIGPYGVLGDYGPLGSKPSSENPANACYSQSGSGLYGMYGMPGMAGIAGF